MRGKSSAQAKEGGQEARRLREELEAERSKRVFEKP